MMKFEKKTIAARRGVNLQTIEGYISYQCLLCLDDATRIANFYLDSRSNERKRVSRKGCGLLITFLEEGPQLKLSAWGIWACPDLFEE
jgi:hypothetical protein